MASLSRLASASVLCTGLSCGLCSPGPARAWLSSHRSGSHPVSCSALGLSGGFAAERVWTDERQYFSIAYLARRHSGKGAVLVGRVSGRELLPAQEAIPVTDAATVTGDLLYFDGGAHFGR